MRSWRLDATIPGLDRLPEDWLTPKMVASDPRPSSLLISGADPLEMLELARGVVEADGNLMRLTRTSASVEELRDRLARRRANKPHRPRRDQS